MDLSKYPITTPFGYVSGYPLNNGFHNGIDYGLPMNTPVVVNGVEIARSNNTGASTGPHLHIGKYQNGAAQNPGVNNGASFNSAVVFDVGKDSMNGNYVRLTADGALWNYLHLADGSIKVTAGQVLQGGNMPASQDQVDNNVVALGYNIGLLRDATPEEVAGWISQGINVDTFLRHIWESPEHQKIIDFVHAGQVKENAPVPASSGSFTDADRATANETNSIVKSIWAKLTSIFK